MTLQVTGGASGSRDGRYRYSLTRRWSDGPRVAWVMLNPSTAGARTDDPTLRRCLAISMRHGFGSLEVVNLFALRSTDPAGLRLAAYPAGPRAGVAVARALRRADAVVAAWGVPPRGLEARAAEVRSRLPDGVLALGLTRGGHPRHPLYVPRDTPLVRLDSLTVRSAQLTMAA
ncbi:MAG: hypothetical protein AMXMBFR23_18120 [Chloroflexota bacterium]